MGILKNLLPINNKMKIEVDCDIMFPLIFLLVKWFLEAVDYLFIWEYTLRM